MATLWRQDATWTWERDVKHKMNYIFLQHKNLPKLGYTVNLYIDWIRATALLTRGYHLALTTVVKKAKERHATTLAEIKKLNIDFQKSQHWEVELQGQIDNSLKAKEEEYNKVLQAQGQ